MSDIRITVEMKHSKSTKGTEVYAGTTDDTAVPTLYIKKSAMPSDPPKTIWLTIESDEASEEANGS